MFQLAICELFNRNIHGHTNQSSPGIDEHILVNITFTPEEFMNNEWVQPINILREALQNCPNNLKHSPVIGNYQYIVSNPNYYKLHMCCGN